MSRDQLIGFRVVTSDASSNFELEQAARECARRLKEAGIHASAYRVLNRGGKEVLIRLRVRKPAIHH
ncbi:MAG TPA: hypothetical protein VGE36_13620 [Roseateles sp.]